MKNFYQLLALVACTLALGQPPAGYYATATGSGYTLKTQLHNIIKNYDPQPYGSADDFFPVADRDLYYENDNSILDPYSENPSGQDPYNYFADDQCGNYDSEGDCYNAEHVIPQSIFGQAEPMRGDVHHLLPTDGRVNGFRSNYPFGIVGSLISQSGISNPTMNGSKLGNNLNSGYSAGYTGIVFEPIDEFKGDIARIYFYFATRYQNVIPGWSYPMFDGTTTKSIADPFLLILLTWHQNDPVSAKEIARNNQIYAYQGNRNPFVDNPGYACVIWGATCQLSTQEIEMQNTVVYPNPTTTGNISISTEADLDTISLYSVTGQLIYHSPNPEAVDGTYRLQGLPRGLYFLILSSDGATTTRKIVIE